MGDRDEAAGAGVPLDGGEGVGSSLLDGPPVALALVFLDEGLGLDDRLVEFGELGLLGVGVLLDLLGEGGDLVGELLDLELGGVDGRGLLVDLHHRLEDLAFGLLHVAVVERELVLDRLVLFILLDQVELDPEVVGLGLLALEVVLVLLDRDLLVLERLAGFFQRLLSGFERQLPRGQGLGAGAEPVAQGLGPLVELVEVSERGGGRRRHGVPTP